MSKEEQFELWQQNKGYLFFTGKGYGLSQLGNHFDRQTLYSIFEQESIDYKKIRDKILQVCDESIEQCNKNENSELDENKKHFWKGRSASYINIIEILLREERSSKKVCKECGKINPCDYCKTF